MPDGTLVVLRVVHGDGLLPILKQIKFLFYAQNFPPQIYINVYISFVITYLAKEIFSIVHGRAGVILSIKHSIRNKTMT